MTERLTDGEVLRWYKALTEGRRVPTRILEQLFIEVIERRAADRDA